MTNVRVNKTKLLEILTKNRAEHREIFLEAQKAFREEVIKKLDLMLDEARKNKKIDLYVGLIPPQDNTEAYDTVLHMLELSEDDIITLTHREFKNYVEDEWDWSASFANSNATYIGSVGIGGSSGVSGASGSFGTSGVAEKFTSKYKKYLG